MTSLDAGRPALHAGFMASKKASGFVTEEQRHTDRITLRLDKVTMNRMRSVAIEHGWSMAETVKQAFEALNRELNEEHERVWHDGELRAVPPSSEEKP